MNSSFSCLPDRTDQLITNLFIFWFGYDFFVDLRSGLFKILTYIATSVSCFYIASVDRYYVSSSLIFLEGA